MATGSSLMAVLLGKTALFGALERDDRVAVARQMRRAAFEPGQTIFVPGDAGSEMFLVVKGRVRLSVFSIDGRLLSFKHADTGDIFGEIAALDAGIGTTRHTCGSGRTARPPSRGLAWQRERAHRNRTSFT